MAVNPFTKEKLVVSTLIDFVTFSDEGYAELDDGVVVRRYDGMFEVYDGPTQVARVHDRVIINPQFYNTSKIISKERKDLSESMETNTKKNGDSPLGFSPPHFGVTVLGASHGFDATGSTTGFIIWINQRGVMVDPPPFSS